MRKGGGSLSLAGSVAKNTRRKMKGRSVGGDLRKGRGQN